MRVDSDPIVVAPAQRRVRIHRDGCVDDGTAVIVDEVMREVGAAAGEADLNRRAGAGKHFAFFAEVEQIAAEHVHQGGRRRRESDHMDPLVEQLENLLAGRAGARPHKVAVDAACHLVLDRYPYQQPAADVAVGDGADHAPRSVTRKQDFEHVGIEPLERLLDRVALGDSEVALVWQFGWSKAATGSGFGLETPLFRVVRYGRGADRARLPWPGGFQAELAPHRDDSGSGPCLPARPDRRFGFGPVRRAVQDGSQPIAISLVGGATSGRPIRSQTAVCPVALRQALIQLSGIGTSQGDLPRLAR